MNSTEFFGRCHELEGSTRKNKTGKFAPEFSKLGNAFE
jgi:hypothetical protein